MEMSVSASGAGASARQTTPIPLQPGHISQLDGLRGLAILLVLIYHLAADIPFNIILIAPVYFGWSGVDLFFVLSGFLITRILMRTRENPDYFRTFYIRRALRIFPLYYGFLTICAILFFTVPALRPLFPSGHDQVFHWLYLDNWTPLLNSIDQQRMGQFWSLAIEEQFYWIWPVIVWKVRLSRLPMIAAGASVLAILLRISLYGFATEPFIYRNTFCRMDALMAGALCAMAVAEPRFQTWFQARIRLIPLAIAGAFIAGMAGATLWHNHFTYTAGFPLFDAGYALFLLYVLQASGWMRRLCDSRVLRWLGRYSYGIYVYHQLVYGAMAQNGLASPGLPLLAASLAGTFGLAVVSYELMEKRFIGLKDRFSPQPSNLDASESLFPVKESALAL